MEVSELEYDRLIQILTNPPKVSRPVIMPDFFVDHFVISGSLDSFITDLRKLADQGGGNLMGTNQFIRRGGNSVNLATALYNLGISTCLIVTTDAYGARLLEALVPQDFDLSHVHTDGRLSSTVSLELEHENRRVNLMLSDSGSSADFSFSQLNEDDLNAIRESRLIALLNLNHNRNPTKLAEDLFLFTRESSRALTFIDLGDPSGNPEIIEPLAKRVLMKGLVDIISMNENEASWFAWALAGKDKRWRDQVSNPEKWLAAAKYVANETGARVDLHTPYYTATISDEDYVTQPVFEAVCRVTCGAGDAWNSGNICGTLFDMDSSDRLVFANAVASLYVSSESASHPTLEEVIEYLSNTPVIKDVDEKLLRAK
jgi:sugar/nucleoside kinase (ribokinase family)